RCDQPHDDKRSDHRRFSSRISSLRRSLGHKMARARGRRAMYSIFHLLPDAPKAVAPYSHAVEACAFVFVTGQLATDLDDDSLPVPPAIEAQTRKMLDNLARVLNGCRRIFADVVRARMFLTDFNRDYTPMNAIYATYFA